MWKTLSDDLLTYINLFVKVPNAICKNLILSNKSRWIIIKSQNPHYKEIECSSIQLNYIWNLSYKNIVLEDYLCYSLRALHNMISYEPVLCNIFETIAVRNNEKLDSLGRVKLTFDNIYILTNLFIDCISKKVTIQASNVFNKYYYTDQNSYIILHLTALANIINVSENPMLEIDCIEMLQNCKVDYKKVIIGYYNNYCNGAVKVFEVLQLLYGDLIADLEILRCLYFAITGGSCKDFSLLNKICEVYGIDWKK